MPLPRMTTRRWMIAVAIVAAAMGLSLLGYRLGQSRGRRLSLAGFHAGREAHWRRIERQYSDAIRWTREKLVQAEREAHWEEKSLYELHLGGVLDTARNVPRMVAYHAALAEKYRRAARYPWLPVEPDPPEPK